MNTDKIKHFGYCRVSSSAQVLGESLDVQRSIIKKQFILLDIPDEETHILTEEGKSGYSNIEKRDQYNLMLEEIQSGSVETVIIYSLSRLNRNLKETLDFVEICDKNNTRLISVYERYDSTVPASKMILYVFSGLAEQQSDESSVRIRESLKHKKRQGKRYSKSIPVGYKLEGEDLVKDDEELKVIQRIKNLYTRGHSYRQIAERFNNEGITTKTGKEWKWNLVRHYSINHQTDIGLVKAS